MTTITKTTKGLVFGELKVNSVCDQPINLLHSDTILQQSKEVFEAENGQFITLNVHDIFVKNENNVSNKANVTFVVSMQVQNEETALFEANAVFNEENIKFYHFDLETYEREIFSLNVADFKINWTEFIEM